MKKKAYTTGVAAVLSISMLMSGTILAAGPVATKVNSGYDEETWARLQDDILEYDEIPLLVHEYNRTISDIWKNLEEARQTIQSNAEEVESQNRKMKELKDQTTKDFQLEVAQNPALLQDQKELGKNATYQSLVNYTTQEIIFDRSLSALKSSAALNRKSTLSSIQRGEDQIVKGTQSLMISYDSLRKQKETLGHLAELYDAQYQLAVNKRAQGMATDADVLAAQINVLSAQNNMNSIESGLLQMKPSLCTLTGWAADAGPVIAVIPPVDVSQIDTMDLEADAVKAVGNNVTLMELRRSEPGKTNDGIAARLAAIEEGEQTMVIQMQSLYSDVLAQKASYESAQTGFAAAQKSLDGYNRMYELGLLSKSDYLGAQISYYQKKAACESADLALRLSIETYQWAVKGYASLE